MTDILIDFFLPVLTAIIAWLGTAYRNKQKKEKDILANVQQIINMQKEYIEEQERTLGKTRDMLSRIEEKYERKSASIRRAYGCKVPSEECPVLISDARLNRIYDECDTCTVYGEKGKIDFSKEDSLSIDQKMYD